MLFRYAVQRAEVCMRFSLARYACALVSRWGVRRVPLFRYAVQRPEAQQAGVLTLYLIYYLIYYRISTPRGSASRSATSRCAYTAPNLLPNLL
jgi:hypothetical protein